MRLGLQETRYRAVVERLVRRLRPIRADAITKQVPKKLYKSRLGTLRLLRDVVETSSRAVIPPVLRSQARQVKEDLPVAARAAGLTIQPWEIRVAEDFDRVIAALNQERPEGLYATSSLVIAANGKRIVNFAMKSRVPSIYASKEAVDAGGLMYYGADLADSYRRVAYYVDRILKGSKA